MELKHHSGIIRTEKPLYLLIVPYGIETVEHWLNTFQIYILLIVPYGIETKLFTEDEREKLWLLIVPYGIET